MVRLTETDFRSRRARYARRWHVQASWETASLTMPPWPGRDYSEQALEWRALAQVQRRLRRRKGE